MYNNLINWLNICICLYVCACIFCLHFFKLNLKSMHVYFWWKSNENFFQCILVFFGVSNLQRRFFCPAIPVKIDKQYSHLTINKTSRLVGFATRLSAMQRKLPTSSLLASFMCKNDVPLEYVVDVFMAISYPIRSHRMCSSTNGLPII